MIALWLLYAALLGAAFALAGVLLERVLRLWRLPVRWVWAFAVAATLAAPLLLPRDRGPDGVVPLPAAAVQPAGAGDVGAAMPVRAPAPGERLRGRATALAAAAGRRLAPLDRPLLLLWAGASALLLLSLARSARALRRRRRGWEPREVDGHPVLVAPDAGPAVIGSATPTVVLPAWALELDAPLRRLVLRHETEHLRAGDPQLLLAGVIAAALAPWNPALWWQLGRLRLAVELDCDRRVLRAHHDVERYGLLLMAVGQRTSGLLRLATPALSEPTTALERRIAAMTARPPRRRPLRAAALLGAAALLVAAACAVPGPNMVAGPDAAKPTEARVAAVTDSLAQGRVYFEFQVEQPVSQIPGSGSPVYPRALKAQGVGGDVIAQFVVDTTGVVVPGTFKVLESSHELFTQAVADALPAMRFAAAEAGGKRVRQLVQQPFQFRVMVPTPSDTAAAPDRGQERAAVLQPTPARRAGAPPRDPNATYFEFQVDPPATQIPGTGAPVYPARLRAEGVTGQVIAQFVVDTAGRVDVSTFKALESSHELFTQAVRDALPEMRFAPAEVQGRKIKQLVQMPFTFGRGG